MINVHSELVSTAVAILLQQALIQSDKHLF